MSNGENNLVAIRHTAVYTPLEAQQLLKISSSTFKRLVKRGLIRANNIGGQYRILGRDLLLLFSPAEVEVGAQKVYQTARNRTVMVTHDW